MRIAEDVIPAKEIRLVLNALRPMALAAEVEFVTSRDGQARPTAGPAGLRGKDVLDDPTAKWAAALQPLADAVTGCFLDWLPKATYPVRYGVR